MFIFINFVKHCFYLLEVLHSDCQSTHLYLNSILQNFICSTKNLHHDFGDDWIPEYVPHKKSFINEVFSDMNWTFKFYENYGLCLVLMSLVPLRKGTKL